MTLINDIMNKGVVTTRKEDNLHKAATTMVEHGIGCLVIEDGDDFGVLTEQDFLKFIARDRRDVMDVAVGEIMTYPAITGSPEMNIYEASKLMQDKGFRRLPVTNNKQLVGIVTQTDLNQALRDDTIREMRAKLDELEQMNRNNPDKSEQIEKLKDSIEEIAGDEEGGE